MSDSYYPKGTKLEFEPITIEAEAALFRLARTDATARENFIKRHLLYVVKLGRLYGRGRYPENETTSAGNAALIQAMERFDPERGTRFCSFLKPYVRAAVAKLFWEDAPVKYSKKQPPSENNRRPIHVLEDSDDADFSHVPLAQRALSPELVVVFPNMGEEEHREFLEAGLKAVMGELKPAELELVQLHYVEDLNFAEIGRRRGVTREAIRRTHNLILERMKKALAKRDITEL